MPNAWRTLIRASALMLCLLPISYGQLTRDQKIADFQQLVSLYAKNYEPYEWKQEVYGFDALKIKPWLDQVADSKTDLDFFDICVKYVASLRDSHDEFILPSDFEAWLPLSLDLYDGKVLVDGIDRFSLPASRFPFQVGDEVVSLDGKAAADWVTELGPYSANGMGNESARKRLAALTMVDRYQGYYPYAPMIGETASLVIRSADGTQNSYTIPWTKYGTPLLKVGSVPSPSKDSAARSARSRTDFIEDPGDPDANPWAVYTGPQMPREAEATPEYLKLVRELQYDEPIGPRSGAAGFGSRTPVFNPPAGFQLRLGGSSSDQFLSGTFPSGGYRVGFIRIPTMSPSSTTLALSQFQSEILYFNQNTDGLVIDVMHNGGGSLCYTESLMKYLIPHPFRSVAYQIRATEFWTQVFSSSLWSAKFGGAEQWVIDLYTGYLAQVQQARAENRGSTGSIPICSPNFEDVAPATDRDGAVIAYQKPILVLTNEFSLSAAESFAGLLQDDGRITVFGTRTDGGGGNPGSYSATNYSMGTARVTRTLVTRKTFVKTPDFPAANHFENAGVYPDIWNEYMTRENLMTRGKPFTDAFSAAIADLIKKGR